MYFTMWSFPCVAFGLNALPYSGVKRQVFRYHLVVVSHSADPANDRECPYPFVGQICTAAVWPGTTTAVVAVGKAAAEVQGTATTDP